MPARGETARGHFFADGYKKAAEGERSAYDKKHRRHNGREESDPCLFQ